MAEDTAIYEAKWTAATRKAYHDEHPENFAGPDMSYPIRDKSDVGDAWGLAGHADNPDAVRRKIIAIAKRLGFTDALPDTAKDFIKGKESDDSKESQVPLSFDANEHGNHDQSSHGNRYGGGGDGSAPSLIHRGGSTGTVAQSKALHSLSDKYRSEAGSELKNLEQRKLTKRYTLDDHLKAKSLAQDKLSAATQISHLVRNGQHHQILPTLQRALNTAKNARASNPDSMHQERIDQLHSIISDVQNAMRSKESTESVAVLSTPVSPSVSAIHPRPRIATIRVRWIEDGARSLNGRIYPPSAVDRLIASGMRKIADSNALPITCFLSHADADEDRTPALIGKATRIWREGTAGMADIDLADTTAARDALGLITGGYLCTESLRAKNAELRTDPKYDVPVVGGASLELDGIDLTSYPGLEQVARIQQVQLAESANASTQLTEVFSLVPSSVSFQLKETIEMLKLSPLTEAKLREEGILPQVTGNSQYMTNDNPASLYAQRAMPVPPLTDPASMPTASSHPLMEAHRRAHDHLANVLDACVTPMHGKSSEDAARAANLTEAGRKLAKAHEAHLIAAHDVAAGAAGMKCEGAYSKRSDPDNDGDDDSTDDPQKNPDYALDRLDDGMESRKKGKRPMAITEEDAQRFYESQGYTVRLERKKTESELLQEQVNAQLAEMDAKHSKQLDEIKALLTTNKTQESQPAPQRRSQVIGANIGEPAISNAHRPLHGRHLQEQINQLDWKALADRTAPLPENIPLELLIKEMEQYYAVLYDNKYGILTAAIA